MTEPTKVLVLTHTDLDGYGARVLAQDFFTQPDYELEVRHLNNDDVDNWVTGKLASGYLSTFDKVIMTDISVSATVAQAIDTALDNEKLHYFVLLDHHKTALPLNKYSWAIVKINHKEGVLASGTSLFNDYLKTDWGKLEHTRADVFTEMVRQYDTWEWKDKFNNEYPKLLNNLLSIYGPDKFVKEMVDYLGRRKSQIFESQESFVLSMETRNVEEYYQKKKKNLIMRKMGNHDVAVTFADRYQSELSSRIVDDFPEVDVVLLISIAEGTMSFRTPRDGLDVSEIAIRYGGGGHAKAAGAPIPNYIVDNFITSILKPE